MTVSVYHFFAEYGVDSIAAQRIVALEVIAGGRDDHLRYMLESGIITVTEWAELRDRRDYELAQHKHASERIRVRGVKHLHPEEAPKGRSLADQFAALYRWLHALNKHRGDD